MSNWLVDVTVQTVFLIGPMGQHHYNHKTSCFVREMCLRTWKYSIYNIIIINGNNNNCDTVYTLIKYSMIKYMNDWTRIYCLWKFQQMLHDLFQLLLAAHVLLPLVVFLTTWSASLRQASIGALDGLWWFLSSWVSGSGVMRRESSAVCGTGPKEKNVCTTMSDSLLLLSYHWDFHEVPASSLYYTLLR